MWLPGDPASGEVANKGCAAVAAECVFRTNVRGRVAPCRGAEGYLIQFWNDLAGQLREGTDDLLYHFGEAIDVPQRDPKRHRRRRQWEGRILLSPATDSIYIIDVQSSTDGRSTTVVLRDSASTTEIWQSSLTENDLDAFVVVMQPAISIATNI